MEGFVVFNSEVRKQVFDFFADILRTYSDPVYYEYIRGHVSKAPLEVRKYVASKCKGDKLLEYFKVRKNYFIVEGTSVLLIKDPYSRRKHSQSKCNEASRGRKQSLKTDNAHLKRSYSCSSALSDNTITSSYTSSTIADEKLVHENYVNKYFKDLVIRLEKVNLRSLDFDYLPKKVKRHLDLYYKKKVVNYFAQFPNTYTIDDEGNVSLKLCPNDKSSVKTEVKSADSTIPSNSEKDGSLVIQVEEKLNPSDKKEVNLKLCHADAILFFMDILIKKKTYLTFQQLGGYQSQAPKELRSFLKFNYKSFKNFFEETSYIFLLDSSEGVRLSKFSRYQKLGVERIRKVVVKASIGAISLEKMRQLVEDIEMKIKTPFEDTESDRVNDSIHDVIAEALPVQKSVELIKEKQPGSPFSCETIAITSSKSNCIYVKEQSEAVTFKKRIGEVTENASSNVLSEDSTCDVADLRAKELHRAKEMHNARAKEMHQTSSEEYYIDENTWDIYEDLDIYEDKIFKFLLMVELFCLEITEKDFDFTVNHEVKAIQYFIEVLDHPVIKVWDAFCLHGTLGKADAKISSFLNKKYKGDNLLSFFQEQPEFKVDPPLVQLAPSYKETFARRLNAISVSINQNSKWDLLKLYESSSYRNILKEALSLFREICNFLEHKIKSKVIRLEGIVTRFPNCLEWIKALEGETVVQKIKYFLHLFQIFEFPTKDYVSFPLNPYNEMFMKWFKSTDICFDNPNEKIDLVYSFLKSTSHILPSLVNQKSMPCLSDIFDKVITVKLPLKYHELVETLPKHVLQEIIENGIGSRSLIESVLKGGKYFLQKGQIDLKANQNTSFNSDKDIDNALLRNQTFQTQEDFNKPKVVNISDESLITSKTKKLIEIESICTQKALKNTSLNKNTDPVDSMLSQTCNQVKPSNMIEYEEDFDSTVEEFESCNQVKPSNVIEHAEDFDSTVEEFESRIALGESCSFSSFEDEQLILSGDENKSVSIEKETNNFVSESRYFKDNCISSQSIDKSEKENPFTKTVILNDMESAIEKYMELLNNDNDILENYTEINSKQTDSIIVENALTQTLVTSQTSQAIEHLSSEQVENNKKIETFIKLLEVNQNVTDTSAEINKQVGNSIINSCAEIDSNVDENILNQSFMETQASNADDLKSPNTEIKLPCEQSITLMEYIELLKVDEKYNVPDNCTKIDTNEKDTSVGENISHQSLLELQDSFESYLNQPKTEIKLSRNQIGTTMGKYLELLNLEEEDLDTCADIDVNPNCTDFDGEILNEPLMTSKASFSSDLNFSKSEVGLHDERTQNVTEELSNVNNQSYSTEIVINEHKSEIIAEMKGKAELLAKEAYQFHEIPQSRIFVASAKTLFEVKKKYLLKTYGPFDSKCAKKNINFNVSSKVCDDEVCGAIETPISSSDFNSSTNLKSADDRNLNHSINISTDTFESLPNSSKKANQTLKMHRNLNDYKGDITECSLQSEINSSNNKQKNASFDSNRAKDVHIEYSILDNVNPESNLNSIDCESNPNEYPLQPISAEIVLLTSDSCIAVAKISSRRQNIYFLKSAFICDNQFCCSNCFDDLRVSDTVSCFVPPTEISRKMWIAFMVSKEAHSHFKEIDSFNKFINSQNEGECINHNMCVNSKSILIQTDNSSAEVSCQVESVQNEQTSQTHLSGDIKLCAITKNSICQTDSLVKSASTQTIYEAKSTECQTEIYKINMESQTNHTGILKEVSSCAEISCQTELTEKVGASMNVVNSECQTISTGQVMITKYYHM